MYITLSLTQSLCRAPLERLEELRCKECGNEFKQLCNLRKHKAYFEHNKKCPSWKVSQDLT